jgi:hypothetical protein
MASNLQIPISEAPLPALEELDAATRAARTAWPVALVSMPFVSSWRPSIQLGLLKALASAHGFPATTFHLNLDFAKQIGTECYDALCEHRGPLLGEWLFARAAFGDEADPKDHFLDTFAAGIAPILAEAKMTSEQLRRLRCAEVPRYLDGLLDAIPWDRFRVVAFTSTFQQNAPAFALAAAIKERFPMVQTLFGGANFEGEMGLELVRTVPCIDYAVIGEGDQSFPELLIALARGCDPAAGYLDGGASTLDSGVVAIASSGGPRVFDLHGDGTLLAQTLAASGYLDGGAATLDSGVAAIASGGGPRVFDLHTNGILYAQTLAAAGYLDGGASTLDSGVRAIALIDNGLFLQVTKQNGTIEQLQA